MANVAHVPYPDTDKMIHKKKGMSESGVGARVSLSISHLCYPAAKEREGQSLSSHDSTAPTRDTPGNKQSTHLIRNSKFLIMLYKKLSKEKLTAAPFPTISCVA